MNMNILLRIIVSWACLIQGNKYILTNQAVNRGDNMSPVRRAARHLKQYLLLYAILAMIIGLAVGYPLRASIKAHHEEMKNLIVFFAILTIYPSMIQLRVGELGRAATRIKAIIIGIISVFVVSPILAMLFAKLFAVKQLSLGFVLTNIVPASSASIGYVLLTGGSIELATVLALISLFGAFAAIPGYMSLYAKLATIRVPMGPIMESLGITLLVPLIAGQLTRYLVIHYRARRRIAKGAQGYKCLEGGISAHELGVRELYEALKSVEKCIITKLEEEVKPHLSLWTMVTMIILIALLVANKAGMVVAKPMIAVKIFTFQAIILGVLLSLVTVIDKLLGLNYEEHMSVAFLSATKNASVAAAIAVMALGPVAALPAALIPVIQAPIAIGYVQAAPRIRSLFSAGEEQRAAEELAKAHA